MSYFSHESLPSPLDHGTATFQNGDDDRSTIPVSGGGGGETNGSSGGWLRMDKEN
jgi:hypothetical protein